MEEERTEGSMAKPLFSWWSALFRQPLKVHGRNLCTEVRNISWYGHPILNKALLSL